MKYLFILICLSFFLSCQKPFNPDPITSNDSTAVYTLGTSASTCSNVIPFGIYKEDKLLDSLNFIEVEINVDRIGYWKAFTNAVNGISFFGYGRVSTIGKQLIILSGKGSPSKSGSTDFIISAGNNCTFALFIDSNKILPSNMLPVAKAGNDTSILLPVTNITLAGEGKDSDGFITSFLWKQISGPVSCTIANPTNNITTIKGFAEGIYMIELTVTDNLGAEGKDTISITVKQSLAQGLLYIQQELDATSPVNDTMNYVTNKISDVTSNYHLQRKIYYENNNIYKIEYWYNDKDGNSHETLIHTLNYDSHGNVTQIFENQIAINTTFLHQEFIYNSDNTLHEHKIHFLSGRLFSDHIFLYSEGNLNTCINLTPDNMGPPDTISVTYDSRINTFNKISPQYYLLDLQSDYYLTFYSEIFYFSKNFPISFGSAVIKTDIDARTQYPIRISINNVQLLRYIYN